MKALFISLSTYDIVGGIQAYNKKFLKALDCNKVESKVISLHDKNTEDDNVICCNSSVFKFLFYILVHSRYADVNVWAHINLSPIYLFFKPLLKGKSLLLTHGVEVWYNNLTKFQKSSLKYFNKVLTVSNFTKEKLISIQGAPKDNVSILSNSIELKNKSGFNSPYNSCDFNIVSILRIDGDDKIKAILNMLDALNELQSDNVKYTIIGKGPKTDFIQAEIANRGLCEQVDMLGFVEKLEPYLEHCDVFTLICDKEGFGIVYLEAMEYSKPCLSAKNCGSSDVVIDGHNGFSVNVDDIETLKSKILELKNNDSLRRRFGDNGHKLLVEKFKFDNFIKVQGQILNDVSSFT